MSVAGDFVDRDELHEDVSAMEAGLDSLSSIDFATRVAKTLQIAVPNTLVLDYPTFRAMRDSLQLLVSPGADVASDP
jgi:acyl carrier protein